jgi:hypothetical protein
MQLGFMTMAGILLASAAQAQICTSTCARYESGQCVEQMHFCHDAPSAPAHSYGAIAYGRKSGAYGYSFSWADRKKAEATAMRNCGQHGDDCEVAIWFDRRCGAVSADAGPTEFWGLGMDISAARADAMNKCRKTGSKSCEIQASQCSR